MNNPAKFHPAPIQNDLGFFWSASPQQQQEQQDRYCSNTGSVSDPPTHLQVKHVMWYQLTNQQLWRTEEILTECPTIAIQCSQKSLQPVHNTPQTIRWPTAIAGTRRLHWRQCRSAGIYVTALVCTTLKSTTTISRNTNTLEYTHNYQFNANKFIKYQERIGLVV